MLKHDLKSVQKQSLTKESIIDVLKLFGEIYDKMSEYEKKSYMQSFIESIELYPKNGTKRGTTVKTIHFRFPVSYKGESVYEVSLPKEPTVETVVLLSHKKPNGHINYKPKERVTYKMIKEYIEAKYGFKVHTAYIAEVKRDLGLPMYDAPNAVEELKQPSLSSRY